MSSTTRTAVAATIDPCRVLTAAEVHAVIGGTVTVKRDDQLSSTKPGCDYNVAGSVLGNYASVDTIANAGNPGVGTAVPGVGDRTNYLQDSDVGVIIYVTKGDASVDITYGSDTEVAADKQQFTIKYPADIKTRTIALAKDAAARL